MENFTRIGCRPSFDPFLASIEVEGTRGVQEVRLFTLIMRSELTGLQREHEIRQDPILACYQVLLVQTLPRQLDLVHLRRKSACTFWISYH